MNSIEIRNRLFELQDLKYRDFHSGLVPNIEKESIIGVRTPQLRALAKELFKSGEYEEFLRDLPHQYYDEIALHGFVISLIKDYDTAIAEVDAILPYIDNWATCDLLSPRAFAKNKARLIKDIKRWIESSETYTIRFGEEMLMSHFLDEDFRPEYLEMVAQIRSDEYYVNMMSAWYFATALAKQYEAALPYIEGRRLDEWTHNKAIQKAIESRRISDEQKAYLRMLKTKKNR